MAEELDHLGLRQHLLDPDDVAAALAHLRGPLAGRPLDLGLVGRPRAEDELCLGGQLERRVQQVHDPLLPRDPADEEHGRQVRVDAVLRECVGARIRLVLLGVDPVVDDLDQRGVDLRVGAHHVAAHRVRHGDDRVGALDPGALAERRQRVAARTELLGLPRPHRLEAVRRHDMGHPVQQLREMTAEDRVPRVRVHDVDTFGVGRQAQIDGHRPQRRARVVELRPRG